jgi:hypothetical protein
MRLLDRYSIALLVLPNRSPTKTSPIRQTNALSSDKNHVRNPLKGSNFFSTGYSVADSFTSLFSSV